MTDLFGGRGTRRGIHLCAFAMLAVALSGCGGSGASSATSAAPTQAAAPSQGSVPTSSPSTASTGSAPASTSTPAAASTSPPPASSTPPTATIGNVTLNWTPPTQNTDGTPLTNLAGYDIHYGTASGKYTQTVTIDNPGIATYVVGNLSPGTYYFSVTAVNSQGTESPLSSEVSTTVN
jgi:predicted phage tail protein